MKALLWTLVNGAMIAALWFGLVEGIDGALNVGLVMVWFAIVTSLFMLSSEVTGKLIREHGGRSVPDWLNWVSDIAVILILAWHGWLWTAGFFLFAAFIQQGALTQAKERIAKEPQ